MAHCDEISGRADIAISLNERLLFAIPKKGRLHQQCLDVLKGSDINFHRHNRLDIALVKNLPIALVFLPAADIPTFVGEGKVGLGITGRDQVLEHEAAVPPTDKTGVEELLDLGFGRCKLQVQTPEKGDLKSAESLVGKTIVTSFTNLAAKYFAELESKVPGSQKTTIKYVGGSVEAACALGVADGIVDLVESGETMRVAGLQAISTVVESSAVLIQSKHPTDEKMVRIIRSRIKGFVDSQRYVLVKYNVERANLDHATKIAPGKRSPTIMTLHNGQAGDWVAVEVMVDKSQVATKMDDLWEAGAKDVLVLPLLNTRTTD